LPVARDSAVSREFQAGTIEEAKLHPIGRLLAAARVDRPDRQRCRSSTVNDHSAIMAGHETHWAWFGASRNGEDQD
jgi:hypothetical protein